MADTGRSDEDNGDTDAGPSLEMPSFSLRRKKRAPEEASTVEPTPEPAPAPFHEREPEQRLEPEPLTDEPVEAPTVVHEPVETPTAVVPVVEPAAAEEAADPSHREPRLRRQLPTVALSGLPAAAVTGVVVGLLAVALSWLATSTCDVVRGTSSCGGGPGLLILVVVLVLLSYAGSLLLRVFNAPDAGSTSILAVGILAVLVLVFLLGSTDEWWMVVAIPVAAVIAYIASWAVTHAVVGDGSEVETPEPHDVR